MIDKTLIREKVDVEEISRKAVKKIVGHYVDPLNCTSLELRKRVKTAIDNVLKEACE